MPVALIHREVQGVRLKFALAAVLPGCVDVALVGVIQQGVSSDDSAHTPLFLIFCLLCVVQVFCQRRCSRVFSTIAQTALFQTRCRIADLVRRAELSGIEEIGSAEIYTRVTQATRTISDNIWSVDAMAQSVVQLFSITLMVLLLSKLAFLGVLVFYGGGGLIFLRRRRKVRALMIEGQSTQLALFKSLNDLLRGAKELRLRSRRGDELAAELDEMVASLKAVPFRVNQILQQNFVTVRIIMFVLLAGLVFIAPHLESVNTRQLNALVANIIFLLRPLTGLLKALPEYERAAMAAAAIRRLEERLERAANPAPTAGTDPLDGRFGQLQAVDLTFAYVDPKGGRGFRVGPVSLTIKAGEIVFFVGGNGSGKTTLLKVLTGLYTPTAGSLRVDGIALGPETLQAYRERYAAIFTDFYLFKKLYGLADHTAEQVQALLEKMQLGGRTSFVGDAFTNLELSTGQRKRVAMVVALLEDRPIYVFDEWAADQDPEFRQYYYEELLPELKRRGKTVLAISHDDRYFHCADRVITVEYGTIRSIKEYSPASGEPHPA